MHTLKQFFVFLAKTITIFFMVLSLVIILISFIHPEWIKEGMKWIGAVIQTLGYWNFFIAFASACIESLPII